MKEMFENEASFDIEITEENKKLFEELFSPWDRFQNGTETINDIVNNCPSYGFDISLYGEDKRIIEVVEKKYFERLIKTTKKMAQLLAEEETIASRRRITSEEVLERFDKEEK